MKSTSLKLIVLSLVSIALVSCASTDQTASNTPPQKSSAGFGSYLH